MTTFGFPLMAVNENLDTILGLPSMEHSLMSPLQRAALDAMTKPIQSAAEMALRQSTDFALGYSATWPDPLTGALGAASQAARDFDALVQGR